jgi:tripeptide aminopeptidase
MNDIQRRLSNTEIVGRVLPRFLKYVRFWTESDRSIADTPSTPGQWELAKALAAELSEIGLSDVELTDHCYVIARLPASAGREKAPVIGFMAHLDTSSDVSGKDVKPVLTERYDGSPIRLAEGRALAPAEFPDLSGRIGDTIITSDGTTLLGADDKAGVAEIVAAAEHLLAHPEIEHGPLEFVFTPDEETGKGLPEYPRDRIRATACYTMDGGPQGELEAECFTAYKADVVFTGKVIHLGAARGKMANAVTMAASFVSMLPRSESPEATDGYYGYYCPLEIKGDPEKASVELYLRDFEQPSMDRRLAALEAFARAVEAQFPGGSVSVASKMQYLNMKRKLDQHPRVLELLLAAAQATGTDPFFKPIRGGTDGSRLTEMGIPTPNVFTGGHNYHSRYEWAGLGEMVAAVETILALVGLWAKEGPGSERG